MKRKKQTHNVLKALALISQLGINMLVPIVMCLFIGIWLDKKLQTGFFLFIFIILGVLAAYKSLYDSTKSMFKGDKDHEKDARADKEED